MKHARALRELAASYARRRAAIVKAQKAQLEERLRQNRPNNWRAAHHTKALTHSKRWHALLAKPLISRNKKI